MQEAETESNWQHEAFDREIVQRVWRFAIVVDTGDEMTHHRAVENGFIPDVPLPPTRIVRAGAVLEILFAQRHFSQA